jgi:hypothetical protein
MNSTAAKQQYRKKAKGQSTRSMISAAAKQQYRKKAKSQSTKSMP